MTVSDSLVIKVFKCYYSYSNVPSDHAERHWAICKIISTSFEQKNFFCSYLQGYPMHALFEGSTVCVCKALFSVLCVLLLLLQIELLREELRKRNAELAESEFKRESAELKAK